MKIFGLVALVPPAITLALWFDIGPTDGGMYQTRVEFLYEAVRVQVAVALVILAAAAALRCRAVLFEAWLWAKAACVEIYLSAIGKGE